MRGVNRPVPKEYPGHPNDVKWQGSKTAIEQMIENAVPVNLTKYIAETVSLVAAGMDNFS